MNSRPSSPRARLAPLVRLCACALLAGAALPPALAAPSAVDPAPGAARRDPAREALVNRVIETAGLREQMQEIQKSVQQGFVASFEQHLGANATPGARARVDKLEAAVGESFRGEDFVARIATVLHENYNEARLQAALAALNAPLIRRMTEVEKQPADRAAMNAFAAQLRNQPLPPARVAVLARLDSASGASALNARVVMNTARLAIFANPGVDPSRAEAAAAAIEAHRDDFLKRARAQTALQFAFTYREVSDADLAAYTAASEAEGLHWFNEKIALALGRQFDAGMARMVKAFRDAVRPGGGTVAS